MADCWLTVAVRIIFLKTYQKFQSYKMKLCKHYLVIAAVNYKPIIFDPTLEWMFCTF